MAWPYTAVYDTYSAGMEVPSALLNTVQERIVDLYSDKVICMIHGFSSWDSVASAPAWETCSSGPGMICNEVGGALFYFLAPQTSLKIKMIDIKYKNNGGAPITPACNIYLVDMKFDTATDAPVLGSALATVSGTIDAGAWGVSSDVISGGIEVVDKKGIYIIVNGAAVGDECGGIRLTVQPLTATT